MKYLILFTSFFIVGCSDGIIIKQDDNGMSKIICKNDHGNIILQASAPGEIMKLKNGNYKFKDANGSYIITKGHCSVE